MLFYTLSTCFFLSLPPLVVNLPYIVSHSLHCHFPFVRHVFFLYSVDDFDILTSFLSFSLSVLCVTISGIRGDCGDPTITISQCNGQIACSSHGVCTGSPTYVCQCAVGWTGADCSERTCPTGKYLLLLFLRHYLLLLSLWLLLLLTIHSSSTQSICCCTLILPCLCLCLSLLAVSWFNYPTAINVAHISDVVECGAMGNCDRSSGVCNCMPNFNGRQIFYQHPHPSLACLPYYVLSQNMTYDTHA